VGALTVPLLSVRQYDVLENAIARGTRLTVRRRGSEFLLIPTRLRITNGRESIDARHPSTGQAMTLWLDELDSLEAVV
jgi:hypothetical protein